MKMKILMETFLEINSSIISNELQNVTPFSSFSFFPDENDFKHLLTVITLTFNFFVQLVFFL